MENRLEEIKKIRKEIISENSPKNISRTTIEETVKNSLDTQKVKLKEIIEEAPDVKSFILIPDGEHQKAFTPFKAGQYVSLKVKVGDVLTSRAYSISSSPKEALNGMLRITIKRVENGLVSNYMLDEAKVGDSFLISQPMGNFGYNSVIDEENVIGIAGGSGITPFMALAKAIIEGTENCTLTVFYSVKTYDDIIFKREIEEINKTSKRVKFVITLTREEKDGYLSGHISKGMIRPYLKEFNTVLMCGPKALYKAMNDILFNLDIPRKAVHYENFFSDYEVTEVKDYTLKVLSKEEVKIVSCHSDETLLVAMEKAGINAPSLCRVGECGFCRSILVEGKIKMVGAIEPRALSENDYIHPCVTYPESDIVLRLDI